MIRKATKEDIERIAEIYIFSNRLTYYPIFKNEEFSFKELTVFSYSKELEKEGTDNIYVYDDGVVKGFIIIDNKEVKKLYVDSFFTGNKIGGKLLDYCIKSFNVNSLWVLEKNESAAAFYKKHGFNKITDTKILKGVGGHKENLIKLNRGM